MNIKKLSIVTALLASVSIMGTGCRKYLDVNTNPNVAQDAGPEFLLPSAQIYLASAMGCDLEINGSIWGQFWTQAPSSSQYKIYEQYSPTASTYDRVWGLLYSSELEDLDQMEKKAAKGNQQMYVSISKLLKAYTYQVITDGWGDIPFTEALKGQPEDGGVVSPHFDAQPTVYDGIITLAKDGMAIMNALPPSTTVTGDLMYNGSVASWKRFGNTLLLKIYMRLSEKNPAKAQAGIQALYASGPTFIGSQTTPKNIIANANIEDAQILFTSTAGNQNPLYSEMVGLSKTQNLVASSTVLDSMDLGTPLTPADPRATVLFKKASATVGYAGLAQGNYTASASTVLSIPSSNVGGDALNTASATAPVKFITTYESKFLQAEAVARGWGTSSQTADALYQNGIYYSFGSYGLDSATAAVYIATNRFGSYPTTGSLQQRIRAIIVQKWFSMTGNQGFEAWTEWRRTGYPDWFRLSANSLLTKTPGNFPHRLLYPDVEVQRNQNFPGQKVVTDRVYWDIH